MKEIKTIIMDLGGVYFTRGSYLAIEKLINIYDIKDRRSVWKFFSDSYEQEGRHIRLGLITMDEFEERFIKKYNIDESKLEYIRQIWFGSYVPHYGMHDLVLKLSKIYRLIVFSGNIRESFIYYHFIKYITALPISRSPEQECYLERQCRRFRPANFKIRKFSFSCIL
ncbi:MAG: hypothetical protein P8Y70_14565 [Candidatus Lokiarchaeota archaeon]